MKIAPTVIMLEIPVDFGSGPSILNLSAIVDERGATLIDTGMPGQEQVILDGLEKEGITRSDLKQIVITHADIDHLGSMKALKEQTGAKVISLETEAGYISGAVPPYKTPPPERLEQNPQFKALLESIQRLQPDITLQDGDEIPNAAGARAIATPGHTPGHMSVYVPSSRVLITADALTAKDGKLTPPNEHATPDMESARASVRKLAQLNVEKIIAYHGGLVDRDAQSQLEGLAASLT